MIILDTCLLSEIRHLQPDNGVLRFLMSKQANELFISSITIGELYKGYHLMSDGRKKSAVGAWIGKTENDFSNNILPVC